MALRHDLDWRGHALNAYVFIFVYVCVCAHEIGLSRDSTAEPCHSWSGLKWQPIISLLALFWLQCKTVAGAVVPPFPPSTDCDPLLCKQEKAHFVFWSFLCTYMWVHAAFYNPVQTFLGIKSALTKTKITLVLENPYNCSFPLTQKIILPLQASGGVDFLSCV